MALGITAEAEAGPVWGAVWPIRLSLSPGAARPCPKAGPAIAASTSAVAAPRRGAVKSLRNASRATDPDNCAAQRVSIKARICLRPPKQYTCEFPSSQKHNVSALLADIE